MKQTQEIKKTIKAISNLLESNIVFVVPEHRTRLRESLNDLEFELRESGEQ